MNNTSTEPGFLTPLGDPPPYGDGLDDAIQSVARGLTGLPGAMVRPRWQPEPAGAPPLDADWCAVGAGAVSADFAAAVRHDPAGQGTDVATRHETVEALLSFYGPNAQGYAARFRDGWAVEQNRTAAQAVGLWFVACGPLALLPELVNQRWRRRVDVTATFRRAAPRTYAVRNILSARPVLHGPPVPPQTAFVEP